MILFTARTRLRMVQSHITDNTSQRYCLECYKPDKEYILFVKEAT